MGVWGQGWRRAKIGHGGDGGTRLKKKSWMKMMELGCSSPKSKLLFGVQIVCTFIGSPEKNIKYLKMDEDGGG